MPSRKITCGTDPRNPPVSISTDIESAIEAEAEAAAAAEAVRSRRHVELLIAVRACSVDERQPYASTDLDENAAAGIVGTTLVTFKRAKVEPDYFVGTRPRWKDADSVREKFAARGRSPTTPARPDPKEPAIDVESDLASAGLRLVRGAR